MGTTEDREVGRAGTAGLAVEDGMEEAEAALVEETDGAGAVTVAALILCMYQRIKKV